MNFKAQGCKKAMTDEAVKALANYCKSLSILDLSYCSEITDEGISAFAEKKP